MTPTPFARMWGAVLTEDGPIAEIRDVTSEEEYKTLYDSDTFRVWCVSSLAHLSREGHSRGPCIPGQPCKKCQTTALSWWWEHAKRTRARYFTAAAAIARTRKGWSVFDFGERRGTVEEAIRDAVKLTHPLVRESNGHGKIIQWIEVDK